MKRFQDIEQLSTYLDGQLNPSDSARLESRLKSDPELASAYEDIRSTRAILRKLPSRKAPRNFTLTRKMAGLNPPVPRSYFTFKFATTFATILFAVTVAVNGLTPRIAFVGVPNYGSGGGGCTSGCGGGAPDTLFQQPQVASEAATDAPALTEAPAGEMLPTPTQQSTEELSTTADAYDAARSTETPTTKEPAPESPSQPPVEPHPLPIPIAWQIALFAVMVIGALGLFVMNQFAKRKWQ
jgi:ferric-dicitrate binding protein FerR (iron transport regulator)